MDTSITSSFNPGYFLRAFCGTAFFAGSAAYNLYHCVLGNFVHPGEAYVYTAISCIAAWVFYHFFSKSWKRITVTDTEITVYNIAFKKTLIIPYADITAINTYRTPGNGGLGGGSFGADFVIELKNDQWVSINESWYQNYGKLTTAIYLHKYGPGHGRERYLARHGANAEI